MQIRFTPERDFIIFHYDDFQEYQSLSSYPAFSRHGTDFAVPTNLPVAFNVIERVKATFKNVWVEPSVSSWLDSQFKLLPIPEAFTYHTQPKDFQEIALRFAYTVGNAGILLDPGMGKTWVVLNWIHLAQFRRVCIVCPLPLVFVWEDEVEKHRPEITVHVVKSTDWKNEKEGVLSSQMTVINYTKAAMLKHRLKEVGFDLLYLDEGLIKDPSTQRTQSLTELSRTCKHRGIGSGTLINNTPLDAFAPVRFIEPSLVGGNFTHFKNRYAITKEMKSFRQGSGAETRARSMVVGYRHQTEIREILESCCIVMTKEEWLQLPPKVFKDIYVGLGDEQKDAYWSLVKNYRCEVEGQEVAVDNPLVMMSKLYQISNGFLYSSDNEEEVYSWLLDEDAVKKPKKKKKSVADRTTHFFPDTKKIEALRTLLTETLTSERAIIWYNMSAEFTLISALLDELGHSYLDIRGGEKDTGGKVRRFNKDNSIRWLVCQSASVNYGVTVMGSKSQDLEDSPYEVLPDFDTQVNTEIFFSLSFSLERYLQQQDRIHRLGQDRVCTYYRLFARTPVEDRIRQAMSDKLSLKQEMLVDVAKTLLVASNEDFV